MASGGSPRKALVLFGPPGSGKGTQAKLLTQTLRYPHISTGDMLREHIKAGDSIGMKVRDLLKAGQLVPDEMVDEMVRERIDRPDCERGFILDGYPRTLRQAHSILERFRERSIEPTVVFLKVDEDKLVKRLTNRRQCPQCGTLYNVLLKPPIVRGRCDIEGARLIVREDDREDVIRERFENYARQTQPVIAFLEKSARFFAVEASEASPEEIFRQIGEFVRNGESS
ncbi:MAG: adenylate kinase [Bryobacteraceae bacterium]|nr:adenylate kinase [Bryobacteraceae bacterium]